MSQSSPLKSIIELENYKFFIPSYQRGYRWRDREVGALLEDIWDFANTEQKQGSFYCLQPLVIENKDQQFTVIDGQQRLTTIFLIVKFLRKDCLFDISYETRQEANQDSREFLQNIESKNQSKATNIDFWHFYEAYQQIRKFFEDKSIDKDRFLSALLNDCKVLWYEITKSENESAVFRRLNIGKIPLQEAENIKALFLSKNENLDSDDIKDRAQSWYEAEIRLREERDFRYCVLANINKKDIMRDETDKTYILSDDISRIEVYLKAISSPQKENKLLEFFYEIYRDKKLDSKWEELESCIDTFQGFASKGENMIDREIFHYIGFLIQDNERISKIYSWWIECGKSIEAFILLLFEKICNKIQNNVLEIDELEYGQHNNKIRSLLLLANLQYLINDESNNKYFEFNRFVLEQWSLEHIYAQNSQSIKKAVEKNDKQSIREFLDDIEKHIDDKKLQKEIRYFIDRLGSLNSDELNKSGNELLNEIDKYFYDDNSLHSVGNLTLLDKDSNSALSNLIFSKKRENIELLGDKLIPILTRKVFDRTFPEKPVSNKNVFDINDRQAYLESIKDLLNKFTKQRIVQ